jgi:hypothetical protein
MAARGMRFHTSPGSSKTVSTASIAVLIMSSGLAASKPYPRRSGGKLGDIKLSHRRFKKRDRDCWSAPHASSTDRPRKVIVLYSGVRSGSPAKVKKASLNPILV